MPSNTRQSQRGAALIMALCFTMVVLAIGIAMLTLSTNELTATRAQGDTVVCRNIAEAGVERALVELAANPALRFETAPSNMRDQALTANVNGVVQTIGVYTVTSIHDTPAGVEVTAEAVAGSTTTATGPKKTISVVSYQSSGIGPLAQGMFGKNRVQINGNVQTDSYNSTTGPYIAQIPGKRGGIRTNASTTSAITLNGNSRVNGNVIYGPGTNVSGVRYNGSVTIDDGDGNPNNNIQAASAPLHLPNAVAPTNTVAIGIPLSRGNTKTVNWNGNDNIFLNGNGTYEADNLNINGNADLYINGDVVLVINNNINWNGNTDIVINGSLIIYAKQNFNMNGNARNNQGGPSSMQRPKNFIIYGTSTCGVVHMNGNAGLNGVIYAPNANVTFNGNAGAYGAVVGNSIDLNGNVEFHYDESLGELLSEGDGSFRIKTWIER